MRELERAIEALNEVSGTPTPSSCLTEAEKDELRALLDPGNPEYGDVDVSALQAALESGGA